MSKSLSFPTTILPEAFDISSFMGKTFLILSLFLFTRADPIAQSSYLFNSADFFKIDVDKVFAVLTNPVR